MSLQGWNCKSFKYIDDDSDSDCSEYSTFEEYSVEVPKKDVKVFKTVMSKEEFVPE
jgi:hypothetical protein